MAISLPHLRDEVKLMLQNYKCTSHSIWWHLIVMLNLKSIFSMHTVSPMKFIKYHHREAYIKIHDSYAAGNPTEVAVTESSCEATTGLKNSGCQKKLKLFPFLYESPLLSINTCGVILLKLHFGWRVIWEGLIPLSYHWKKVDGLSHYSRNFTKAYVKFIFRLQIDNISFLLN